MCGIVGVTGESDVLPVLVDGLRRLEYRGYDSAGLAVVGDDGLWRVRAVDGTQSVRRLGQLAAEAPEVRHCGIAHTRWATHGAPGETNAHPLVDCTGRVAIVHNGIIENHTELQTGLVARGHRFSSQTDSEVLAHLVEEGLAEGQPLVEALRGAVRQVRGAFAIGAIWDGDPGVLVAARRSSPVIVGQTGATSFLASDVPALLGRTKTLFALEDDQVAELRPDSVRVTTLEGEPADPTPIQANWDLESAQRGGYDDFMSKEIHEQPEAVASTLLDRRRPDGTLGFDELRLSDADLASIERVFMVACGSSYHAGMVGKYAVEHWARLPTEADIASEFRYRDPVLDEHTLAVCISQSGETADTLEAVREAKRSGARTLVVTNVVGSSMAREADGVVYTRAGPEIGVASTKCHLAQLAALDVLALALAQRRTTMSQAAVDHVMDELLGIPALIAETLKRTGQVDKVAKAVGQARDFFFLGRHVGFPVALEGALKLKEISYLRAEGYPAGELKHGPIALIEPGTVVVGVATRSRLTEKMLSNVAEVRTRGATVVLVAEDGDEDTAACADHVLWVPPVDPLLAPLVNVVPLQLLAYVLARRLGHDVDRPRNLAKTVTVE